MYFIQYYTLFKHGGRTPEVKIQNGPLKSRDFVSMATNTFKMLYLIK